MWTNLPPERIGGPRQPVSEPDYHPGISQLISEDRLEVLAVPGTWSFSMRRTAGGPSGSAVCLLLRAWIRNFRPRDWSSWYHSHQLDRGLWDLLMVLGYPGMAGRGCLRYIFQGWTNDPTGFVSAWPRIRSEPSVLTNHQSRSSKKSIRMLMSNV